MKIIVGLGNPGSEYEFARHNAGFLALDKIRETWDFPEFKFEKKFNAEITKNDTYLLAKPQTFMNNSGQTVKAILDFYKLTPEDLTVIQDDMDITLGKYKIATDSRSAGHNGVQNIIDSIGTQKFKRIRIGIGKSEEKKEKCLINGHDYVLGKFPQEEREILEKVLEEITDSNLF